MKRGESGLSFVLGVNKPLGLTSHDVINRCRSAFGEMRIGHTGTLDPLAEGVMIVCVGSAARLDNYLAFDTKTYEAEFCFGRATDTDDEQGAVIAESIPSHEFFDPDFAHIQTLGLRGTFMQVPPRYSALKVGGKKACDEARAGRSLEVAAREVTVFDAQLLDVYAEHDCAIWKMTLRVSKGTYIRSLARDLGELLGCPAHLKSLKRTLVGSVALEDCVSLEALQEGGLQACAPYVLDPVLLLGKKFARVAQGSAVENGGFIAAEDLTLQYYPRLAQVSAEVAFDLKTTSCTSLAALAHGPLTDGEVVSLISEDELKALYVFDKGAGMFKPAAVFKPGIKRSVSF